MTKLKKEIQQKCFSLLKEFMDAVQVAENDVELQAKKEEAQDALELLKHMDVHPNLTSRAGTCTKLAMACPPAQDMDIQANLTATGGTCVKLAMACPPSA
jgi:hypothetical protein